MEESQTFSALIDTVVQRSGRKDRLASIIAYARTTIRECLVLDFFDQSLIETQVTVDAIPFIWDRPSNLRSILAIRTPHYDRRNKRIFMGERKPGMTVADDEKYFYLSGNSYAMANLAVGDVLDVAYYEYSKALVYTAPVANRPARYDLETEVWVYHQAYDASDETRENARDKVTNWLLTFWYELIAEGTQAKLYKLVNDEARMRTSYALYKGGQKDLAAGESTAYMGKY